MARDSSHHSELQSACQKAWDDMVAQSEEEPDVSLIAAYVDGHLNEAESRRLGRHICACPLAWEILESMLPEGRPLPLPDEGDTSAEEMVDTQASESLAGRAEKAAVPSKTIRRSWQLALAAGWLMAIAIGGWLWWADVPGLQNRISRMEEQRRDTACRVARAEVGELAQSSGGFGPVYAIGDPTVGLMRVAAQPQSRGSDEPSDDVRKQIDNKLASIRSVLADAELPDAPDGNSPLRLIEISGLILAGRLDEADTLLVELEERFSSNKVRNARAVWQIAAAQEASLDKARELKAGARKTLQEIAPKGPPEAWLNLALYYMAEGDDRNAMQAFEEYLKTKPDAVVAEIIRQEFGL